MVELSPILHVPHGTRTRLLHARRDHQRLSRQLDELYTELNQLTTLEDYHAVEACIERVERQMATLSGTIDGLKEALKPTFGSAP